MNWSALQEVGLPNGLRADILAIGRKGDLVCIEIKSSIEDFAADRKWHRYAEYADHFYFAVDRDFPIGLLPATAGQIVTHSHEAFIRQDCLPQRIAAPERRAMMQRFACLAADRLLALQHPDLFRMTRAALSAE